MRRAGAAAGLGATIALFCDVIIADERAVIGDPHVKVGLVAGDGGFEERRIGNGQPDAPRGLRRYGPGYVNRDQFLRPFAVAHHLQCQIQHQRIKRRSEICKYPIIQGLGCLVSRSCSGKQHQSVTC